MLSNSSQKPRRRWLIIGTVTLLVAALLLFLGYQASWTGFGQQGSPPNDKAAKTLWDWLDLLIVPIALALTAYFLNRQEKRTETAIQQERSKDEALRQYIDQMKEMILAGYFKQSSINPDAQAIAQALTLTTVRQLDGVRKGLLLQFLREAHLIDFNQEKQIRPLISLIDSDFSGLTFLKQAYFSANLSAISLEGANLQNANLRGAQIGDTDLRRTNLSGSILTSAQFGRTLISEANLSKSDLSKANLSGTDLNGSDLSETNLQNADMYQARLRSANLSKASLKNVRLTEARLGNSKLIKADLTEADLSKTDLQGTNWQQARIIRTNFSKANLVRANLSKAHINNANWSETKLAGSTLTPSDREKAILGGAIVDE